MEIFYTVENLLGTDLYNIFLMWGLFDMLYIFFILISLSGILSYKIAQNYQKMTKIGLYIMRPLRVFILILEFGGLVIITLIFIVNFWPVILLAMLITAFIVLMQKIIFKDAKNV